MKKKLAAAKLSLLVKYKNRKDVCKITVDGSDAFVEQPADPHGSFVGDFRDLQLP